MLLQQQQSQIDESILKAQHDSLMIQAEEQGIRVAEFEGILQPIVDSCTKDSISTGMYQSPLLAFFQLNCVLTNRV